MRKTCACIAIVIHNDLHYFIIDLQVIDLQVKLSIYALFTSRFKKMINTLYCRKHFLSTLIINIY